MKKFVSLDIEDKVFVITIALQIIFFTVCATLAIVQGDALLVTLGGIGQLIIYLIGLLVGMLIGVLKE